MVQRGRPNGSRKRRNKRRCGAAPPQVAVHGVKAEEQKAAAHQCEYISASGVALGLFKGAAFAEETASLTEGDILVLYTDGITEVVNGDEDEFGEERLEALITENAQLPVHDISQRVLQAVADFAGEQSLFDDATLVVIKRTRAPA